VNQTKPYCQGMRTACHSIGQEQFHCSKSSNAECKTSKREI